MAAAAPTSRRAADPARGAPTGAPPQGDANTLARAIALAAALAASLFAPSVFDDAETRSWYLRAVATLALGVALLALSARLPRARTLRAVLVLGYVSWIVGTAAVPLILLGTASVWEHEGLAIAAAAAVAWMLAIALNRWEARRAFALARRLDQTRLAAYAMAVVLWLPLAAWRLGDAIDAALQPRWQGSVAEGLAGGLAVLAALAFAALALLLAAWLPRAVARAQQRGLLAISAGSETLWFTALVAVALPLALAGIPGVAPRVALEGPIWVPEAPLTWGDVAWRVLAVALAHGATRLLLGRAGAATPVPLLVLVAPAADGPGVDQFLARLPGAWGAGPVTCLAVPDRALHASGTHLAHALRLGQMPLLFPQRRAGLEAWAEALPPPALWRALPVREAYADHALWSQAIAQWLTPHTWVLWLGVPQPQSAAARFVAEQVQDALPPGRSATVAIGAGRASWSSLLAHAPGVARLPAWQGDAPADFAAWLRARVRPAAARRVLVLHAQASQAALADRLAARLSGQHDAEGRFVEAAALGAGGLWRLLGMPVWVVQVGLAALQRNAASRTPAARLGMLAAEMLFRMVVFRGEHEPATDFDVVLLCGARSRDRAWYETDAGEPGPLLAAAQRRLALVLDAQAAIPRAVDARIDAMGLGHGDDGPALERAALQWLERRWVETGTPVPAAPPPAPAAPAPATPITPVNGLLALNFGLAESRRLALTELLRQRVGQVWPLVVLEGDSLEALALAGAEGTEAVLMLTAVQAPASRTALQGVAAVARDASVRVWQAPMAAGHRMSLGERVPRLPTDWDHDDPVPGPNLPAWADALSADLLVRMRATDTVPKTDTVLCLAGRPAREGRGRGELVVGRASGAVRVGATVRPGWHRSLVRAVLALSDGRVVTASEDELVVWHGGDDLQRLPLSLPAVALAEVVNADGGRSVAVVGRTDRLLVLPLDGGGTELDTRLPVQANDVAGFDLEGFSGWLAIAAGPEGVYFVDPLRGSTVRATAGRVAYAARRVAVFGSRTFFCATDSLGAGLVGVHVSGLREARPITLGAWRAPVQALCPLSESELLFGDDAGGLWRWRPEDPGRRPEPVAQVEHGIDAIVRGTDGAVTLLAKGALVGAGQVQPSAG